MPRLNVQPTKSNLLILKRQLAFAEEGYDLLEQKRQILIFELMSRLERAQSAEAAADAALRLAFAELREALLDIGSEALDRAASGAGAEPELTVTSDHLMGIGIPRVLAEIEPPGIQFGLAGTSAHTDAALRRFTEALPVLAVLAEIQTTVTRLARELRKTQRRCNALSKNFIPDFRETIHYIAASLEERERESFSILKLIRERPAGLGS